MLFGNYRKASNANGRKGADKKKPRSRQAPMVGQLRSARITVETQGPSDANKVILPGEQSLFGHCVVVRVGDKSVYPDAKAFRNRLIAQHHAKK